MSHNKASQPLPNLLKGTEQFSYVVWGCLPPGEHARTPSDGRLREKNSLTAATPT